MSETRIFDKIDFGVLSDLLVQEDIRDINCLNHNEIWVTSNHHGHYRLTDRSIQETEINRIRPPGCQQDGKGIQPRQSLSGRGYP